MTGSNKKFLGPYFCLAFVKTRAPQELAKDTECLIQVFKVPFLDKRKCHWKVTLKIHKNIFLEKFHWSFFIQICKWVKNCLKPKRKPHSMTDVIRPYNRSSFFVE